jgi:hypothetical protein
MRALSSDTVRTQEGAIQPRPAWANELGTKLRSGYEDFQRAEFAPPPPREELHSAVLRVEVVYREDGDIIFQLFPNTKAFPADEKLARAFLAEAIDTHFGDTAAFEGGYTPELESWAIKAKNLHTQVSYNHDHHVLGFVHLLMDALTELE